MKIKNHFLVLEITAGSLKVTKLDSGENILFGWPACAISLNGRTITPSGSGEELQINGQSISQKFHAADMDFEVIITLSDSCWFRKQLKISRNKGCRTVDYVDADIQRVDDRLERCGYIPGKQSNTPEARAEEEGSGFIPGCGYPLIGEKYFIGLEHPAAFNNSENGQDYCLRHYPQWNGDKLESISSVLGWSNSPVDSFREYLDTIRLPGLKKPLISFCTFWSDPYVGNYEYAVHYENYLSFFEAFAKLGLEPDVFTLDAGWNDRQSIFGAKAEMGGDPGLKKLQEYMKSNGVDLSLWLSHNGPMGIAPEYLQSQNIAVGKGQGSVYCLGTYGVMMDKKFEETLRKRFCQLITDFHALHFKIDWDNDCATNPDFNKDYPTINHVRQATVNAMIRIAAAMREKNPEIVTRNGWWTSPWWLCHASHTWLCDSGDSEYSSLPAKTQRDAAATHRDALYYAVLRRDKSMLPLDCFDNHEFPDALRNPFVEEPVSWTNALWLSFMRGSTYLAYTLQPEKLEDWQVDSFKAVIKFCREYSENIFVKHGRMIGGCPSRGEIYGFMQPGEKQSWCLLRNPLPLPQNLKLTGDDFKLPHEVKSVFQFYPNYQLVPDEFTLPAHGLKILIFDSEKREIPFEHEFMTKLENGKYRSYFPSSLSIDDKIRPLVKEIYQIPQLEVYDIVHECNDNKNTITFTVKCPYRMRNFELQIGIKGKDAAQSSARVMFSRYPLAEGSRCMMPMTEYPVNSPGYGENKNPDLVAAKDQKYYSARLADGGESFYRLEIDNVEFEKNNVELWLSGYEAPSRNSLEAEKAPFGFDKALPCQHPLGFPRQIKIEIK
jgi:hypothetical protein